MAIFPLGFRLQEYNPWVLLASPFVSGTSPQTKASRASASSSAGQSRKRAKDQSASQGGGRGKHHTPHPAHGRTHQVTGPVNQKSLRAKTGDSQPGVVLAELFFRWNHSSLSCMLEGNMRLRNPSPSSNKHGSKQKEPPPPPSQLKRVCDARHQGRFVSVLAAQRARSLGAVQTMQLPDPCARQLSISFSN